MKNFTSLPYIVFNRISRKYGVRILAIKNMRILLTSLKYAQKFTERFKMIEIMMFTDCRSQQSEDLFIYLYVMGMFDPSFSNTKTINYGQASLIRRICEDYLTKDKKVYIEYDKLFDEELGENKLSNVALMPLIKSIIMSYRMIKIERIEELGFIYMMLSKNHFMEYKTFVFFLSTFNLEVSRKVSIAKIML